MCGSGRGGDAGLGPGIDATIAAGFQLRAAGGQPTCVCALAAEIPPRHRGRHLSSVLLQAMSGLAREAGLNSLIAPVRPSLKDRYPTIPLECYARWTLPDGSPFDPWMRVHTQLGARIGPVIPRSLHITGTVEEWESWTQMRFPETGDYVFPAGLATVHIDANAIWATTGNPTSGSSTRLARRHEGHHCGIAHCRRADKHCHLWEPRHSCPCPKARARRPSSVAVSPSSRSEAQMSQALAGTGRPRARQEPAHPR